MVRFIYFLSRVIWIVLNLKLTVLSPIFLFNHFFYLGLAPVRSSKQDQIHASIVSTLLALMDGMDGRGACPHFLLNIIIIHDDYELILT